MKLATSLVSYSLKASTFYNVHNAIKYVDNKFGVSSYLNPFSDSNAKEENKKTESESTSNNNYLKLFGYYINNFKAEDKGLNDDDNDNQINAKEIDEEEVSNSVKNDTLEVSNVKEIINAERKEFNNKTENIILESNLSTTFIGDSDSTVVNYSISDNGIKLNVSDVKEYTSPEIKINDKGLNDDERNDSDIAKNDDLKVNNGKEIININVQKIENSSQNNATKVVNGEEIININDQIVDNSPPNDTVEDINENEYSLHIGVYNSTTLTYSKLDDQCDMDDILCIIKDDIYANSILWT